VNRNINAERRGDATPVEVEVSISRSDLTVADPAVCRRYCV